MAAKSKIQWTDSTWNPIKARLPNGKLGFHCEKVSPACANCYAEAYNRRNLPACGTGLPYTASSRDQVAIAVDNNHLTDPIRWRKPRRVFVCSMTDLFASFVPDHAIDQVFAVMACARHQTFQVLTKRPERAAKYLKDHWRIERIYEQWYGMSDSPPELVGWPLPNVWLGATTEDQDRYDERIVPLLSCPAAMRFLSCEPLLGPIDLSPREFRGDNIHQDAWLQELGWVIIGGESGPRARPMPEGWAKHIVERCRNRKDMGRPWPLPCFMKQGSAANWPRYNDFESFPKDLRVREFPRTSAFE